MHTNSSAAGAQGRAMLRGVNMCTRPPMLPTCVSSRRITWLRTEQHPCEAKEVKHTNSSKHHSAKRHRLVVTSKDLPSCNKWFINAFHHLVTAKWALEFLAIRRLL